MQNQTSPLVNRPLDEPFAQLSQGNSFYPPAQNMITGHDFLHHVTALARTLPAAEHVINLVDNRYLFTVAFCAAIVKKQVNLLPQNRSTTTITDLAAQYNDSWVLHDNQLPETVLNKLHANSAIKLFNIEGIDVGVSSYSTGSNSLPSMPFIALDQLAAIAFTSGSTGTPKPNLKYWRTLVDSTLINAQYMLKNTPKLCYGLATVPAQHMWGLETSVLLPLQSSICLCDARPLFPMDIADQLSQLPTPRVLITTPVHLRTMLLSQLSFAITHNILCATAPLTQSLAQQTEQGFNGELTEIYGCSEVGSMAFRATATEQTWTIFKGISITPQAQGASADAKHLPSPVVLSDNLEFSSSKHFTILGRDSDTLEIAGKRGSLMEMNKILLELDDLADGQVVIPNDGALISRPVVLAVPVKSDDTQVLKNTISHAFAQKLDPVFVPRRYYFVEALPREENGKIKQQSLQQLLQKLSATT